jgi:hypothetical protein
MKLFLSHSRRDKALVREITSHLPSFITSWLDDDNLIIGQDLEKTISAAINESCDYVVLFISRDSVSSDWVRKELDVALSHERQIKRIFVLPILLDDVWDAIEPIEFRDRLYLTCFDQSASQVKHVGQELSNAIYQHLCATLSQEHVARLEAERKKEEGRATADYFKDMLGGMNVASRVHEKRSLRKLRTFVSRLGGLPADLKLERLSKKVDDLLKEFPGIIPDKTEEEKDIARSIRDLVLAAMHDGVKAATEDFKEDLDFWKEHRERVDESECWNSLMALLERREAELARVIDPLENIEGTETAEA